MKLNLDRKLISGSLAAKIQNFQANQKNSTTKGNAINWLFVEKLNKHVPQPLLQFSKMQTSRQRNSEMGF